MSYCILHPIIKIACNLFTKLLIETSSHLCVKSMKPCLSCISVHWGTLLLDETLCTSRSSLKLDPDLTQTLSLTFTFPKWSEVFEDGAIKSKVCSFFFLLCKEQLFPLLSLTSQCLSLSLIEGMFGFTSFLYSISWFLVHVEAHGWCVWEAFSCQVLFSLNLQLIILYHREQGNSRFNKLGLSGHVSRLTSQWNDKRMNEW